MRFFLLGILSCRHVVIPFGWLHLKIKLYLVGETVRGLSPLLQQCPTLTLGWVLAVIRRWNKLQGCRLTPPKTLTIVHVISFLSRFVFAPKQSITLPSILGDGGMPGGAFSGIRCTNHPCTDRFRGKSVDIFYGIQQDANPSNTDDLVGM
jgi:hypothetical protein